MFRRIWVFICFFPLFSFAEPSAVGSALKKKNKALNQLYSKPTPRNKNKVKKETELWIKTEDQSRKKAFQKLGFRPNAAIVQQENPALSGDPPSLFHQKSQSKKIKKKDEETKKSKKKKSIQIDPENFPDQMNY